MCRQGRGQGRVGTSVPNLKAFPICSSTNVPFLINCHYHSSSKHITLSDLPSKYNSSLTISYHLSCIYCKPNHYPRRLQVSYMGQIQNVPHKSHAFRVGAFRRWLIINIQIRGFIHWWVNGECASGGPGLVRGEVWPGRILPCPWLLHSLCFQADMGWTSLFSTVPLYHWNQLTMN